MGDMADLELGQIEHCELGGEYPPSYTRLKTCYGYRQTGLHWNLYQGKWRLFDSNGIHKCAVKPSKAALI